VPFYTTIAAGIQDLGFFKALDNLPDVC